MIVRTGERSKVIAHHYEDRRLSTLKVGDLCLLRCDAFDADGHIVIPRVIFEEIDLMTYPSYNDFKGDKMEVAESTYVLVTRIIGRPWNISMLSTWKDKHVADVEMGQGPYDVIEILIHDRLMQVTRDVLEFVKRGG
jgi:hypothetical protein